MELCPSQQLDNLVTAIRSILFPLLQLQEAAAAAGRINPIFGFRWGDVFSELSNVENSGFKGCFLQANPPFWKLPWDLGAKHRKFSDLPFSWLCGLPFFEVKFFSNNLCTKHQALPFFWGAPWTPSSPVTSIAVHFPPGIAFFLTLPKSNIAPESKGSKKESSLPSKIFQGPLLLVLGSVNLSALQGWKGQSSSITCWLEGLWIADSSPFPWKLTDSRGRCWMIAFNFQPASHPTSRWTPVEAFRNLLRPGKL